MTNTTATRCTAVVAGEPSLDWESDGTKPCHADGVALVSIKRDGHATPRTFFVCEAHREFFAVLLAGMADVTLSPVEVAETASTFVMRATREPLASKPAIRVTINDRVLHVGGNRAGRAAAVIVVRYSTNPPKVLGCRADLAAATQEAHRLETRDHVMHRGVRLPAMPATFAVALPVDGDEVTR